MHENGLPAMDDRLRIVFRDGLGQPEDDAFRDAVVGRIRKRLRLRRLILAAGVTIGGLIAILPAYELSVSLGEGLSRLSLVWDGAYSTERSSALMIAAGVALLTPVVTMALED